ncbi:LysR family transcriptional regulator [Pantoea sp. 1.19]|uniref:LysR family transcriptional regulator n=1 Tax=Pantoea sp. 1.19 TaxID=1925589 RepID=UPI000948FC62|nr:LysR family transcriptional regulator [Pantoea sp. 1.19]
MATAETLLSNTLPSVRQLQCFLAVAHELNYRRAAERLRMTQPPLTRQIQALEAALNQALFIRNTHGVTLTPAGRTLVVSAGRILQELHQLTLTAAPASPRLRIGLTCTVNFEHIPPVQQQLLRLEAEDHVETPYLTSAQLLQYLAKNTLDLALVGEHGAGYEDILQYRWVGREPLRIAMPSDHPASLQQQVALEELCDLPLFWFARSANPVFYDKCERYFDRLAIPLKRVKEPEDSLVMLSHIAKGSGFALLPQSKCTFALTGLCYRDLTTEASQRLHIDLYAAMRIHDARQAVLHAQSALCTTSLSSA